MTTAIVLKVLQALAPIVGPRAMSTNSRLALSLGLTLHQRPTLRDALNRDFMLELNEPITLDEVLAANTVKDLVELVYRKTEPFNPL